MNARGEDREQDIPQIEEDGPNVFRVFQPHYSFEVAIPEMPLEKRNEYSAVHSDIVEFISGELRSSRGIAKYHVEFTDGRQELVGGHSFMNSEEMPSCFSCMT
jgi:hypothetical protein